MGSNIDNTFTDKKNMIDKILEKLYFFSSEIDRSSKINYYNKLIQESTYDKIVGVQPIISTEFAINKNSVSPMDSAWPMKCHDTRHTSQSPYSTANNQGIEKWRFQFTGNLEDTPVIDENGVIYCKGAYNHLDRYLFAIYPNGTEKWKYKTDGLILGSSPAIDKGGTIYIGSWDTGLYAINPDGTKKWRVGTGGSIASSPAIGDDGTIYIGHMSNDIVAINPNGTIKWSYPTGYYITGGPAIGDDGTIYIGSGDTYLYAMNPDGTLKWRFKTGDYVKGPPSISEDGTIYIGSFDDYLYGLYPNGTIRWKCKIGKGTETNPSIASDGTIYIGSYDGHLYAVNPNGTMKWSFKVIGNIHQSSPAISSDGTIYFGTDDSGYIYAVNPDGTEKWKKKIAEKWVESSPSIAEDGTVYIGSTYDMGTGYLHAFGNPDLQADADGPYYGLINTIIQFPGSAENGAPPYDYHWDFGDGHTSEEQNPEHYYTEAGEYDVVLTVTDEEDNTSIDTTFAWIQETNLPPTIPIIDGPSSGKKQTSLTFDFVSEEPDGTDLVWYYIEWGDGTNSGWLGPFDSGEEITKSHQWSKPGTYVIRARAKDVYDDESDEAEFEIKISNPRTRAWFRFIDMFPILERILGFIC